MAVLRWQWTLSNGAGIEAVIDSDAGTETVLQKTRVLSESPRGGKPDGHVILAAPDRGAASERPPIEAVVTFEPTNPICILRVDNHEVAPSSWPVRERRASSSATPSTSSASPLLLYTLLGLGLVALLALGIFLLSRRTADPPPASAKLDGTHRAPSGLFIAHHPNDLEPRPAILPAFVGGVVLEDKAHSRAIVIAATLLEASTPRDPWLLQQRFHDEALANVPKSDGKYEQTARRDDTCAGERGAVVVGVITKIGRTSTGGAQDREGQRARVWSCAFVHDSAAYFTMYMVMEPTTTSEERRLRAVVDATELTRLADLGATPDPLAPPSPTPPLR